MRRFFHFLGVSATMFFTLCMASCNNDITENPNQNLLKTSFSSEEFSIVKDRIKTVLTKICKNAYDGNSIDVELFESIMSEEMNLTKDELIQLENFTFTRASSGRQQLTEGQNQALNQVTDYFADKNYITENDFAYVELACQTLPEDEALDILLGVALSRLTIDAAQELIDEGVYDELLEIQNVLDKPGDAQYNAKTSKEKLKTLLCNLSAGALGAIYGYWTTGILISVCSGGTAAVIGGGVSIVSGAIISTIAC